MNLLFRIRRRYIMALLAIAVIITGYTLLVLFQLEKREDDAVFINRAGQQRMLSQKIALYVFQLNDLYLAEQNAANQNLIDRTLNILRPAIDRMEDNHVFLSQHQLDQTERNLPDNLSALYFLGSPTLDELTIDYIAEARKWLDISVADRQLQIFRSQQTEQLLQLFDRATKMFEQNSIEEVLRLRNFELFLWLLTIFTLIVELIFIFRPMEKMVLRNLKQLDLQKTNAMELLNKVQTANSAKDVFMTKMNHELRTPINGIKGSLSLLDKSNLTDNQIKDIDTAILSTEDLLFIYTEIVDFSLLTSGDFVKEVKLVSLKPFFDQIADYFEPRVRQKGLNLSKKFDFNSDVLFSFDSRAVRKILYHLLYNALKYTPKGGIEFSVKSVIEEDGVTASLEITLTDTGYGMAAEQVDKINEAFQSSDHEIYVEGLGLGLMACQNMAAILGADFSLRSLKMKGTTIWLSFPVKVSDKQVDEVDHTSNINPYLESKRPANQNDAFNILLVEDMVVNQQVTMMMLENKGMGCEIANNGKEALEKLKADSTGTKYQLILMDIQMPVMDGIEATREIRAGNAGSAYQKCPIVALTAHAVQSERHACFDAGMDAFLTKPIQIDKFYSTISRWVAS